MSKDGRAVIYEKVQGIQANKFIEMIKDFKEDPKKYFEKYKDIIAQYPWMQNPLKVTKEFAENFMGSFSEMLLFSKNKIKGRVMHGDPHTGNFFVTFSKKGIPKTEFIDTGNCVLRSRKDIAEDLKFFSNYFVGNSEEMAKYFIKRAEALPKDKTVTQLVENLKNKLDERIFKSGCRVTDFGTNQKIIDEILDNEGIILSTSSSTSLKAQLQAMFTINELNHLAGLSKSSMLSKMIPDVLKGTAKMSLRTNPFEIVEPAIKKLKEDPDTGFGTLFQMVLKK